MRRPGTGRETGPRRLASACFFGMGIALNAPWIAFCAGRKQPEDGRTKLRHYPNIDRPEMFEKGYVAAKSGHSRGSAVDLTLYHLATGALVPMGGDHDLMDPVSHHGAKGITQVEARNREYLCSIMEDSGFSSYECEWWHYTATRALSEHLFRFSHHIVDGAWLPGPCAHPQRDSNPCCRLERAVS